MPICGEIEVNHLTDVGQPLHARWGIKNHKGAEELEWLNMITILEIPRRVLENKECFFNDNNISNY